MNQCFFCFKYAILRDSKKYLGLTGKLLYLQRIIGDVAQLARALRWQRRGRGFEPHLLHLVKTH